MILGTQHNKYFPRLSLWRKWHESKLAWGEWVCDWLMQDLWEQQRLQDWIQSSWSCPSCQDGVIDLFVGVGKARDLLQGPAVTFWQQFITGRVQDCTDALKQIYTCKRYSKCCYQMHCLRGDLRSLVCFYCMEKAVNILHSINTIQYRITSYASYVIRLL